MISQTTARRFAEDWIAAWNRRDLEAILAHYADDVELTSPLVISRLDEPTGTIRGKDRVRSYFAEGLRIANDLRFELRDVLVGVDGITLIYTRETGSTVADVLTMDTAGKALRVRAFYCCKA